MDWCLPMMALAALERSMLPFATLRGVASTPYRPMA